MTTCCCCRGDAFNWLIEIQWKWKVNKDIGKQVRVVYRNWLLWRKGVDVLRLSDTEQYLGNRGSIRAVLLHVRVWATIAVASFCLIYHCISSLYRWSSRSKHKNQTHQRTPDNHNVAHTCAWRQRYYDVIMTCFDFNRLSDPQQLSRDLTRDEARNVHFRFVKVTLQLTSVVASHDTWLYVVLKMKGEWFYQLC